MNEKTIDFGENLEIIFNFILRPNFLDLIFNDESLNEFMMDRIDTHIEDSTHIPFLLKMSFKEFFEEVLVQYLKVNNIESTLVGEINQIKLCYDDSLFFLAGKVLNLVKNDDKHQERYNQWVTHISNN